jgi:hypothetical protein
VILKRESVTSTDVERLAAVATVDEGKMFFVSPRLLDSDDGRYPRRLGHSDSSQEARTRLIVHGLEVLI